MNLRTEDLSLSCFKKHCRDFYKNKIRGFDPDRPHVVWVKIIVQFSFMTNSLYMLFFLMTSFSFFSFLIQYIVYGLWKSNTQVMKKAIFCHGQFILHSCPFQRVYISHGGMSMLQVKIKFRSKFFKPTLILYFLSLLALIIQELGPGDKGNWEST